MHANLFSFEDGMCHWNVWGKRLKNWKKCALFLTKLVRQKRPTFMLKPSLKSEKSIISWFSPHRMSGERGKRRRMPNSSVAEQDRRSGRSKRVASTGYIFPRARTRFVVSRSRPFHASEKKKWEKSTFQNLAHDFLFTEKRLKWIDLENELILKMMQNVASVPCLKWFEAFLQDSMSDGLSFWCARWCWRAPVASGLHVPWRFKIEFWKKLLFSQFQLEVWAAIEKWKKLVGVFCFVKKPFGFLKKVRFPFFNK
jgi:hypothetical protein